MLELSEDLDLRTFRMEARYTAARLSASPETRALAKDFEEAHDKLALLEEEESALAMQSVEAQAAVEMADEAWDDTILGFQRRLLELVDQDVDAELYRNYFAEIPSHVTSLSYQAEILISKALEGRLSTEPEAELASFADRLESKRLALESAMHAQVVHEVEEARFANRAAMAKAVVNKLRRLSFASLEETARSRGQGLAWCARFFHTGGFGGPIAHSVERLELPAGAPRLADADDAVEVSVRPTPVED